MDFFVLDDNLRRVEVIDTYSSLIWSERYDEIGDFQLDIASDSVAKSLLNIGTRVTIAQSFFVMEVQTITDTTNDEGEKVLRVQGVTLENILRDRANYWANTGIPAEIVREGLPYDIVNNLFNAAVRTNTVLPQDNLTYLAPGLLFPPGSMPFPEETYRFSLKIEPLYDSIQNICKMFGMGFRLVRAGETGKMHFEVYLGDNRTTLQTTNSTVIFSPELDNLTNTTELKSKADFKNVAYVKTDIDSLIVYADTIPSAVKGFDRRVLFVDAGSIDIPAGPERVAALEQRGKEELAKHRVINAFDGEIPQIGSYVYHVDYDLGDLVEMRGADGLATNMRVTEQIFVSDKEGERSYPTLMIDYLITPGSWYAWDTGQVWNDAIGVWEDA